MNLQELDTAFKLKRKWQIALRRYVLEQKPSPAYAPYFGLPIFVFREWIESQFVGELSWDNFGSSWQFDHVLPLSYFDFQNMEDMRLCWNFINIRVADLQRTSGGIEHPDVLTAKAYFEEVYRQTAYPYAGSMVRKIESLEARLSEDVKRLSGFIEQRKDILAHLGSFSEEDFERINTGLTVDDIVAEKQLMARFGS